MHVQEHGTYKSLQPKTDKDGKVWLYVKWAADATAKQGKLIRCGTTGWISVDPFDVDTTQDGFYYVGFPEKAQTTNTYGWAQIGGYIEDAVLTASATGTIGHYAHWNAAALTTSGSNEYNKECFAIYTATSAAGTNTADLMLIPQPIQGAS
jgi:hypothetical protein